MCVTGYGWVPVLRERIGVHRRHGVRASRVLGGVEFSRRVLGESVEGREPQKEWFYPCSHPRGDGWAETC